MQYCHPRTFTLDTKPNLLLNQALIHKSLQNIRKTYTIKPMFKNLRRKI